MAQAFGEKMREFRTAANLTQRELAKDSRLNFTYLSKLETGNMPPPSEQLITRLCVALGIRGGDRDDLFRLAGRIPEDVQAILLSSRHSMRLVRAIAPLCDDEIEFLIEGTKT